MSLTGLFGVKGPVDAARAAESLARQSFTLVDEPEELLIDPTVQMDMLEANGTIHGDCDDVSMFVASIMYCLGLRTRFKAVIAGPDGSYQHVFVEYMLRGVDRWIPIDPTIEGIPVYASGDWIAEEL